MNVRLGIAIAFITGLITVRRATKKVLPSLPPEEVPGEAFFVASVPGHRRAAQSEVTPDMTANAIKALSQPLGAVNYFGTYAVAVENHSNRTRGVHKGASVFMKA